MEKKEQMRQFEYKATSNLVLTSTTKRETGPSSEVLSLATKVKPSEMRLQFGQRVARSRPAELEQRIKKAKIKRQREDYKEQADYEKEKRRRKRAKNQNVLSADVDDDVYRPRTRETKAAYEILLSFIQRELPDKPHDVLRSAADEVLAILKDDSLQDKLRQKEIESLFRRTTPMGVDRFSELINIGRKITDYRQDETETEKKVEDTLDEDAMGVNLVFEADEEELDDDIDEIKDEDDDEDMGVEADDDYKIESKADDDVDVEVETRNKDDLDARSIDAYWLQRKVHEYYKDPIQSQKMAEDVFGTLADLDTDDRNTENKLVLLLDYDKFDLIRLLLKNRHKVVYCIKLARAKDDTERAKLEKEMEANPLLKPILDEITRTATATERGVDLERKLMSEARSLAKQQGTALVDEDDTLMDVDKDIDPFWVKRAKSILDLDNLTFDKGSHHMSQKEVKLPKSSEVINKKGYQEVHIPAVKAQPFGAKERFIKKDEIPSWAQPAFSKTKTLNRIQSKVYQTALFSAENMLICAPTGAGKTNCAMLTILREIGLHRNADGSIDTSSFKIVYVAPMKSLVQEMVLNFGKRLKTMGITVKELTGDQQLTKAQIQETQIIVTTPEKWDIVTRKSGDRTYTQLVRLVIIDEIHLLHDSRGPVLEAIIARTIRQIESTQELTRLVGLSATLPNYEDVAMLLRVNMDKGLFFFDNSYRPVPLQQQFIGITQKKAFKRMELMNKICYEKVMAHAGKEQVLVFVHSRKETANTAKMIRDMALEADELGKFMDEDSGRREILVTEAEGVSDENLKELLPYGLGIHHAGMNRKDRTLVEELYADRHIQCLVSTATLAWGVNLPAHTVIIKGTQIYSPEKGDWVELSPLDIMQMLGRAGRPQYDEYGEGVVITSHKELHYYLSLMNEQLPVESQLISRLCDSLNAEIVMGSVTNIKEAVIWLGYTYLFVRMLRAPHNYGIPFSDIDKDKLLEQRRIDLAHTAACILDKHNLVKYDRKTGSFQVTDLGRVASHFYITYHSMAVFNENLKPSMSDIELFRVFSMSSEFKYMSVRQEEKLELAQLLDKVPIPVKESMEESSAKVNVLLQSYILRLGLEGLALVSDMVYITQSAGRIMRAIFEIVLRRGWASVTEKTLNICLMIQHRMWTAQSPLRQFRGLPPDIIKRLEAKTDFPWERLYDLEPHALGDLVRYPKSGRLLHKAIHQLPRLDLQGHVQPITRTVLRVELTITPDFVYDTKVHGHAEPFWIWVEDVDSETVLHYEYFILKQQYAKEEHLISFTIPIHDPMPPQYYVRVMSDRWLGSTSVLPVSFRHLILPERFPSPTELLDLQPLPVSELQNEKYMSFYNGKFDYFNPIQTQVFNTLYKGDSNVLVAAPTGSGKTVCAELAVFRMLSTNPSGRCVYIAPMQELATERYHHWRKTFGKRLGLQVNMLTGEIAADLKLLAMGQIIISTPQHWDHMSRRWTTRKNVQDVALLIVDELHLIGGLGGPILEVIVSRMRYIASQTEKAIRIVGLSTSVANAADLGLWLGCTASSLFNFHPNVRPIPLEIRVQGFDINHFNGRQLAMTKPCYLSIKKHSPNKPVIIFACSRKHTRRMAIDLVTAAAADDSHSRFLHADPKDLEDHLKNVKNRMLRETLACGVGFYHKGLSDKEKLVVETLYNAGAIQVVVSEYKLCWGMTMSAHLVVILGTQYYEGSEHRYVDYPITDVVQMMGRANPKKETSGKCSIFCHAPKKEYFKKFLYEAFPVESHLDHSLADHFNAEIVTKRIENVQDAVDYLTWTFFYRRLANNPNYYNLQGVSHRHLSDHMSELVESTLGDLEQSNCIAVEDETDVSPLNSGKIAAYYYIRYTTVERFASSLTAKTKLKGILYNLCWAAEFENIPVRHKEDNALRKLARHLPLKIEDAGNYNDPHTKTNVLLQAHFSRVPLAAAVAGDLSKILVDSTRLLRAMVDVLSSKGALKPALTCMEMSQMVTQGMWRTDNVLLQLPHITKDHVAALKKHDVDNVYDFIDMDDELRVKVLGLTNRQLSDVAQACNTYPNVDITFEVVNADEAKAGNLVTLQIQLERDEDEEEEEKVRVPSAYAPRYPTIKNEGWWLLIGDPKSNELLAIKRLELRKAVTGVKLQFTAPRAGKQAYFLYLMCDSYLGCDQENEFKLTVAENDAADESSSDESEDEDVEMAS